MTTLFETHMLGAGLLLKNRAVMAPMTRTRTSPGDVPNAMMATYYGQRAGAGLIVTEATDVSPRSKGYAWTPGIYSGDQIRGWQLVTDEVHRRGGTIFLQAWHVGRLAHTSMLPEGEAPWGATGERASDSDVFAHDASGKLTFVRASTPRQIETAEVAVVVDEFTAAFEHARRAGFDGVELHAANGYLFDQFMNAVLNTRSDQYGGQSPQNRTRLLLEVVDAAIRVLGAGRVGVRLSPFGRYGSMPFDPRVEETLEYLSDELGRRGIAYLHLVYQLMPSGNVENSRFDQPNLSDELMRTVRERFPGTLIWCGGFDGVTAQAALDSGLVDLIAFGRPYIANPDLVDRLRHGWPLAVAAQADFYTRDGEKGFTDFPAWDAAVRLFGYR